MDENSTLNEPLDDLERDAERDRAKLAGTVEALRDRLGAGGGGPSGMLAAGARSYAVGGLRRRVEEHPLQSVALAAGIAYPLIRIVTKIPAPVLLLGAGVALAGRGGPDRAEDRIGIVAVSADGAGPADGSGADPTTGSEFREPRIAETAGPAGTSTATGATSGTASKDGLRRAGSERLAATSDAASRAGTRAIDAGRAGGETLLETIRRNPAVAGGASLLIGAALAAMLPRTRIEGRAFGETAEDVRDRARVMATEGIEAAQRVVGAAADEAEKQNLTGSGVRGVIRDGADRASGAIRDAADDVEATIDGSAKDRSD